MITAPWGDRTAGKETVAPQPPAPQLSAEAPFLGITGGHPPPVERITVPLIPNAGHELQRLHDRTGLSMTDILNRAITLYEFLEAQLAAGKKLLIRDESTGEIQTVLIS